MELSLIAAAAQNRVIGSNGKIPWNIKADQERFKELTAGNVVIMGRKTFDEIFSKLGRPLPERINIVLTSDKNYFCEGAEFFPSLDEALSYSAEKYPEKKVFICGGQSLYEKALGLADKIYLTRIKLDVKGDRFFPEFNECDFIITEEKTVEGEIPFTYFVYERKKMRK
ncbi:MAG: dihydrofolate reductase [Treponema sp.]|uniref:dihydrofolate reductase n=1 Tax=Treponema sp. TaxID=166 RepID=UPI00298E56F7|nr:dihydrofolate reductase [Treponema sp.]MBR5932688.1 dihydrofolate reductase [Treponema sp.]